MKACRFAHQGALPGDVLNVVPLIENDDAAFQIHTSGLSDARVNLCRGPVLVARSGCGQTNDAHENVPCQSA